MGDVTRYAKPAGHQGADRQQDDDGHVQRRVQDGGDVRADRVEGGVSQVEQADLTQDDVETEAQQRVDADEEGDVDPVIGDEGQERIRREAGRRCGEQEPPAVLRPERDGLVACRLGQTVTA